MHKISVGGYLITVPDIEDLEEETEQEKDEVKQNDKKKED